MYCQKCGQEIMDEAVICVHCGCAQPDNQKAAIEKDNKITKNADKLKTGKTLNIVATIFFAVAVIIVLLISTSATTTYTTGNSTHTVTETTDIGSNKIFFVIQAIIIVVGYIIGGIKTISKQKTLGILYLIASTVLTFFVALFALFLMGISILGSSTGVSFAFLISTIAGILQIIAGSKFASLTL